MNSLLPPAISMGVATAAGKAPQAAAGPSSSPPDTARFDLAAYRGKVVYLDFWASWCAPCKKSFPWMRELQERYGHDGFAVVAVNLDRDLEAAKKFLAKNEAPFRIVYDPKGRMAEAYKIEAMPSSFLYDRSGKQRGAYLGFKESETAAVEKQIRSFLAEARPDSTKK